MVFRFEDSEITPTYEEMCVVMDHRPEQDETPALPPGPGYDLTEIVALCPVYLPDGWRIRLVTTGSMNLNYVLYASLDRSMAYFPDRINRQYEMIQRVPRIHNFESGLMMQRLLTSLVDRWRNRNTRYLGQGVMQDTVTPEYVNWFFTP
ncbi:hypothetical protein JCGZ_20309 [Jatropha curcas]|uniref:Aminotransferase-like plant mobile domain-containing protein n=1 Tax=Jatropha curcas TaxID=180498 RepID=A0A067K4A8_JATCU|nr:hypothetical protein JCGZ_20309 [Jatropha curcas]